MYYLFPTKCPLISLRDYHPEESVGIWLRSNSHLRSEDYFSKWYKVWGLVSTPQAAITKENLNFFLMILQPFEHVCVAECCSIDFKDEMNCPFSVWKSWIFFQWLPCDTRYEWTHPVVYTHPWLLKNYFSRV
jgi:hypothetical protein